MKKGSGRVSKKRGGVHSRPRTSLKHSSEPARNILLIPGLGADVDMYMPLIRELVQSGESIRLHHLRYITPASASETLNEYAHRLLADQLSVSNRHFDCVIGTSLGGAIAQQALEDSLITTDQLLLVSTLFHGGQLTLLANIAVILSRFVPGILWSAGKILIAIMYPIFRFYTPWSILFSKMILRTDPDLLFIAPFMIRNWRSNRPIDQFIDYHCPIYQFHGTLDPLISYAKVSRVRKPEFSYAGGGHLIFVTRAREIADIILHSGKKNK